VSRPDDSLSRDAGRDAPGPDELPLLPCTRDTGGTIRSRSKINFARQKSSRQIENRQAKMPKPKMKISKPNWAVQYREAGSQNWRTAGAELKLDKETAHVVADQLNDRWTPKGIEWRAVELSTTHPHVTESGTYFEH
jgi:hypothetical protein